MTAASSCESALIANSKSRIKKPPLTIAVIAKVSGGWAIFRLVLMTVLF